MTKAHKRTTQLKQAALLLAVAALPCHTQAAINAFVAPVNPAFTAYSEAKKQTSSTGARSSAITGRRLGHTPAPVNLSADSGKNVTGLMPHNAKTALTSYISPSEELSFAVSDSSFDLRNLSRLTPIRDQGTYGTCWSFASYASLESSLMPAESWDFSENNLANNSGFYDATTDGMEAGGNSWMSAAYWLRWSGPVSEADDPYDAVKRSGLPVRKHVQEALWLPQRATTTYEATYVNNLKSALVSYGPVTAEMYWDDAAKSPDYTYFYNSNCVFVSSNNSRDCPVQSALGGSHIIAIVGWDDSISKNNFTTAANGTPAGDGAWITRNSWGTAPGMGGYFYISYYDTSMGDEQAVFNSAEATSNYSRQYSYDRLGWVNSVGNLNVTGWMAMQATSIAAGEELKAVGFYSTETGASYNVYIYTGSTPGAPRSGTLAYSGSGTLGIAGYHTVPLTTPVTLAQAGTLFSTVVQLTNPSYLYPIPIEYYVADYTPRAAAAANETFFSANGTTWDDMITVATSGIAGIKTYSTGGTVNSDVDTSTIVVKGYPSPCDFNKTPVMTLGGMLTEQRNVTIHVYSLSGQLVRSFTEGNGLAAGNQALWDGKNENGEKVASGVYIVVFAADGMDPKTEKVAVLW